MIFAQLTRTIDRSSSHNGIFKSINRFIYLIYLIIYLKLTNLQKYSTHIYIELAGQTG